MSGEFIVIVFVCFQGAQISCYGEVDSKRFLLGDANGYLHMVFLTTEESMEGDVTVVELKLEKLGEVSDAAARLLKITYLSRQYSANDLTVFLSEYLARGAK